MRQEGRCDGHAKKEMGGWMVDDGWVDGQTDRRMGVMGRVICIEEHLQKL